jgi:hypothetical protein
MKKLWVFGDSFSEPYNKVVGGNIQEYIKWKNYDTKIYSEFISNDLNIDLKYYASGGVSNRTILSKFISVLNEIKDDDIIIIGWTSINRSRVIDYHGELRDISMSFSPMDSSWIKHFPDITIECLQSLQINRNSSPAFYNELIEYMDWIKFTFKNNLILFWTWDCMNDPLNKTLNYKEKLAFFGNHLQTIKDETNGVINDDHFSEKGHRELANILINKIL